MSARNRKKRTPIPGLAQHIAAFTNGKTNIKHELAAIRAAFADKVYAASSRIRKETTQCRI